MKRLALMYYEMGYGCGQCIIKAADRKYKIGISSDFISAAAALGNGCGYGGQCTVITAVIIIFGIMFDEMTMKRLRIKFLDEFRSRYNDFNCCRLSAGNNCVSIIASAAEIADGLIEEAEDEIRYYNSRL